MTGPQSVAMWAFAALTISAASAAAGAAVTLPPAGWRNLPWPEQARLASPARLAPVINVFVLAHLTMLVGAIFFAMAGTMPPVTLFAAAEGVGVSGAIAIAMASAWLMSP